MARFGNKYAYLGELRVERPFLTLACLLLRLPKRLISKPRDAMLAWITREKGIGQKQGKKWSRLRDRRVKKAKKKRDPKINIIILNSLVQPWHSLSIPPPPNQCFQSPVSVFLLCSSLWRGHLRSIWRPNSGAWDLYSRTSLLTQPLCTTQRRTPLTSFFLFSEPSQPNQPA
jgi:hypothetical protein